MRDSIVSPELGTQANPIVIHVDEGWCHDETHKLGSDADTEIMATSKCWGTLISGKFAGPVDESVAIDSSSDRQSVTIQTAYEISRPAAPGRQKSKRSGEPTA